MRYEIRYTEQLLSVDICLEPAKQCGKTWIARCENTKSGIVCDYNGQI